MCEPGGVQFIDFGSDPDFNNCVDGLVLVDLTYLKANRYQRYIGAHLGAQNRHKRFSRLAARCALAGLPFRRIGSPEKARQATPPESSGQCSPRLAADALTGYKPYPAR